MFKMSAFSVDTSQQTTPPFVDGVVHNNRLVQLAPHGDQTLALDELDSAVVHMLHALFWTLLSGGFGCAKIIEIC